MQTIVSLFYCLISSIYGFGGEGPGLRPERTIAELPVISAEFIFFPAEFLLALNLTLTGANFVYSTIA